MKKILLATAAVFAMASSASALDFGNGLALNTEVNGEYNTGTELFVTTLTPELAFAPVEGLGVYVNTDFVLYDGADFITTDTAFTGATVGATYVPAINLGKTHLEAYIEAEFDEDFNRGDVLVGATLSF